MHGNDGRFEQYDMVAFQTTDPFENTNNIIVEFLHDDRDTRFPL